MKRLLLVAILGALVGAVADVLLLYSPNGSYEDGTYRFLTEISDTRLAWGHYLGILFIPLECLGFYAIYQLLKNDYARMAKIILWSAIYTLCLGTVYHGMLAHIAYALKSGLGLETAALFEPLGLALFIGFAVLSLLLFYIIRFKTTPFPKWTAWFNPFFLYLIFVLSYVLIPAIGNIIIVAGFNLALFIFFLTILPYAKN